ncbi:MAG: RNA methyltransferase [Polyangiaceae bacterium]|nr:RNA methyltransferase [Polyangiaceae bacterium]
MLDVRDHCVATTFPGLEQLCAQELAGLGLNVLDVSPASVTFASEREGMYRANLWLRTALRVLLPIAQFDVGGPGELYQRALRVPWEEWIDPARTFAVNASVHSQFVPHSKYAALRVKDAVVDRLRDRYGRRPSVDVGQPDVRLRVTARGRRVDLALDSSGEPLSRRGYRLCGTTAPLNEAVAAAVVLFSGWNGTSHAVDPLCGSGTLLVEAALVACNVAPGSLGRSFGFMTWPEFDPVLWHRLLSEARSATRQPRSGLILGGDHSADAVVAARANAERAGVSSCVEVRHAGFQKLAVPRPPGVVLTNPPYGVRLDASRLTELYRELGDRLKRAYGEYEAWILSGNLSALKSLGLRSTRRITLLNGNIECRLVHYPVVSLGRGPTLLRAR